MESLIYRRVSGRTKVVRGTQGNAYDAICVLSVLKLVSFCRCVTATSFAYSVGFDGSNIDEGNSN